LGDRYFETTIPSDTNCHAVVENPTGEIIEFLKTHGPLTQGSTVIVAEDIKNIDFCNCIEVPLMTEEQLNLYFPGHPEAARKCEGNMWNFEFYKQFSHTKDKFLTPKDYIKEILTTPQGSYITNSCEEHGQTWGLVHENYPTIPGLTTEDCSLIAESLSQADVYDQKIYETEWDFCRYFQIAGIAYPATVVRGRADPNIQLRPGSAWTKVNNQKMRENRLKKFHTRDYEKFLHMLYHFSPRVWRDYNLTPQDIDTLNHLLLDNKLKPSAVLRLKKELSAYDKTLGKEQHTPGR
jgi:hypothetical protein